MTEISRQDIYQESEEHRINLHDREKNRIAMKMLKRWRRAGWVDGTRTKKASKGLNDQET